MADAQASGACGRKIVWVQVPSPALFFALRIKNWSGGPIRITLPGMMQKLPGRVFLFFPEKKIIPTGHFMPNTHFKSIPEKKFP